MSGKKLLVADDSLTIQKVIRLALSHEGYEIQAVSEGNEAIEQILLARPGLVLIDVSLPGKTAVEVKQVIDSRPELSGTRFILMSSAFETIDEASVDRAGFAAKLTKPFDPAHLRKLVAESLGFPGSGEGTGSIARPRSRPPEAHSPSEQSALTLIPPPPPMPGMAPRGKAEAVAEESDIRELTQSTLKLAGFDDLDWSVSEGSRKDPSSAPAPGSISASPNLPPLPAFEADDSGPELSPPGSISDQLSSLSLAPGNDASAYYAADIGEPLGFTPDPSPRAGMDQAADIDAIVQRRVEEAVLKATRDLLPQLAEKILKAEINRLLNEVP